MQTGEIFNVMGSTAATASLLLLLLLLHGRGHWSVVTQWLCIILLVTHAQRSWCGLGRCNRPLTGYDANAL